MIGTSRNRGGRRDHPVGGGAGQDEVPDCAQEAAGRQGQEGGHGRVDDGRWGGGRRGGNGSSERSDFSLRCMKMLSLHRYSEEQLLA